MASDYTSHYNLDKYVATDKPNLRDQYNAAMDKIDTALYAANQAASASQADADAVASRLPTISFDSTHTVADAIAQLGSLLPSGSFDATNTVKKYIDDGLAAKANASIIPSGSFSSTNTVKKYIDDGLAAINNKKKLILCFGDSYGRKVSDRGEWVEQLSSYLGTSKYTLVNYCVGGASWINTGNPNHPYVGQQLVTAISEHGSDDVYACIFICGYNDGAGRGGSGSYTGITTDLTTARSAWPNAKCVVGINWYNEQVSGPLLPTMQKKAEAVGGVTVIDGMFNELLGEDALFPTQYAGHPNVAGMWRITNLIIAALEGGCASCRRNLNVSNPIDNYTTTLWRVLIQGCQINIIGSIANTSQLPSTKQFSSLMKKLLPHNGSYIQGMGNGGDSVYLYVYDNGTFDVIGSGTGVAFNSMTFQWVDA